MFRRNQKIDVTKDAAAGFVEYKIAKYAIVGDETTLFPQGVSRGRKYAPDDHISDLAFRMS